MQNGLLDKKIKGDKTSAGSAIVQSRTHSESPFESYFTTIFPKIKLFSEKNSAKLTRPTSLHRRSVAEPNTTICTYQREYRERFPAPAVF